MVEINVSPDEYLQIMDVAGRATMTIGGHVNEAEWCDGVARILNIRTPDLIRLLGPGPHRVVIYYGSHKIDRFRD